MQNQLKLSSLTAVIYRRRHYFQVAALFVLFTFGFMYARRQQANSNIALAMCEINADFLFHSTLHLRPHHAVQARSATWWQELQSYASPFSNAMLGTPLSDRLHSLRIKQDSTDQQLEFLSQLVGLEELELATNSATDETLKAISQLPRLRVLRIAGDAFSAEGLLALRNHPTLEHVDFSIGQLSDIEYAVVRSELPKTVASQAFILDRFDAQASRRGLVEAEPVTTPKLSI